MRLDEWTTDFNAIAQKIRALPGLVQPGDMIKVAAAIEGLRKLPFPPGYLDETRDDMLRALSAGSSTRTSVYLAFYGGGESASHLKIGIAKSVRNRLSGIKTGNPLPMLWTFTAAMPTREEAAIVERAILDHLSEWKAHGEWIHVSGMSLAASEAIVDSLAEVAVDCLGRHIAFTRFNG